MLTPSTTAGTELELGKALGFLVPAINRLRDCHSSGLRAVQAFREPTLESLRYETGTSSK